VGWAEEGWVEEGREEEGREEEGREEEGREEEGRAGRHLGERISPPVRELSLEARSGVGRGGVPGAVSSGSLICISSPEPAGEGASKSGLGTGLSAAPSSACRSTSLALTFFTLWPKLL
jgi:hypothetical protein